MNSLKKPDLFRRGDVCDSCYVVCRGTLLGFVNNAQVCFWSEGDVIGLDDVLLSRGGRSFTCVVDNVACGDFDASALLLKISASSLHQLSARNFLHFLSGALMAAEHLSQVLGAESVLGASQKLSALDDFASHFYPKGSILTRPGDVVSCVFYVQDGGLTHSIQGHFGPGSLVFLPEFLASNGKIARCTLVAEKDALVVSLNFEHLVVLMSDAQFKQRVLQSLEVSIPSFEKCTLEVLCRGDVIPKDSVVVCGRADVESSRAMGEMVVRIPRIKIAQQQQEHHDKRCRTIVVVEVTAGMDKVNVTADLCFAFREKGTCTVLSGSDIAPGHSLSLSQMAGLSPLVVRHLLRRTRVRSDFCLLYVPLSSSVAWALECASAADTVLLIALEGAAAAPECESLSTIAKSVSRMDKHFALVHPSAAENLRFYDSWKAKPNWFKGSRFHHVRALVRNDYLKLSRNLRGFTLALILGGHAEGVSAFAYLGVLEAFRWHKIPVDILGGCYSGAVVGAMFSLGMRKVRIARRLTRMQPRYSVWDPLLDLVLPIFDSALTFAGRFRSAVETTFSFAEADNTKYRRPFVVDDMNVSNFFVTATHVEYAKPAVLDQGVVTDLISHCMRIPLIMPGSLVYGSLSQAVPTNEARQRGAWKVISANVNMPFSGDCRGAFWWSWVVGGTAQAALSHLAVAASVSQSSAPSDYTLDIGLDDIEADEYRKGAEVAQRGFDAAHKLIRRIKADPEMVEILGIDDSIPSEAIPSFEYVVEARRINFRKMFKIAGLALLGVFAYMVIRRKALDAEAQRIADFVKGEAMVKTDFIVDPATIPVPEKI